MARGEVLQLLRSFSTATSMEEYLEVIDGKTASLFAASCASAGYLSGFKGEPLDAIESFGRNLGFSFQIIDDILDYTADLGELGKTIGKDFMEGKVTLPIILLMECLEGDKRREVADIFLKDSPESEDFQLVLSLMRECGTLEKAQDFAQDFADKARENLAQLPHGKIRDSLESLASYVTRRRT